MLPPVAPLEADRTEVRPGGTVHLVGGPFHDLVPEAEQPSTTTTTLPGGGQVMDCPQIRAAEVLVSFEQPPDGSRVPVATVEGDRLDLDVVIPATATPGPALLRADDSWVDLTIVAAASTTGPRRDLPRTGAPLAPLGVAGVAMVAAGGLVACLASGRTRRSVPRRGDKRQPT